MRAFASDTGRAYNFDSFISFITHRIWKAVGLEPPRFTRHVARFTHVTALLPSGRLTVRQHVTPRSTRRNERRLQFLVRAGEIFHQSLDVQATLSNVADLAVEWFADICFFDLLDDTTDRLYVTTVAHRDPEQEPLLRNLSEILYIEEFGTHPHLKVTRTGEPFFVSVMDETTYHIHAASREHLDYMRRLNYRSKIVVPVTAQDVIFGSLTFVSTTKWRHFDDSDLSFALDVGRRAGLAVANAKQYRARAAVEERLRDSELRFRILAEAIPVLCWTADAKGSIDWYNQRWYEYTGQRPDDALGWGWQAAHHPDDFVEVMRKWPLCLATGKTFEMEFRLHGRDGLYRWFLARAEPMRDQNGTIVRWYGSNVDIDAQKTAHERMKQVALTLQGAFLPKHLPQRPGMLLDAYYLTAEQDTLVGGDWYDAVDLAGGRLLFSIGDVAGHGLDASVAAGRLRQAILLAAFDLERPGQVLRRVADILAQQDPHLIATAIVGFVDPSRRRITYASAGHPPPMLATRSGEPAEIFKCGQPPLGSGYEGSYEDVTIDADVDSVVAFYTDGLTEFTRDIFDGERRLRCALSLFVRSTLPRPARAVTKIVFDGAVPPDDVAILVMQFPLQDASLGWGVPYARRTWRFHSSDPQSAHLTRVSILDHLREFAKEEGLFRTELAIGEALANTVEHAPGVVELELMWNETQPVLLIRDNGPGLADLTERLPSDPTTENGRGLFLILACVEDASVRRLPGYGTELRLVLPLTRRYDVEA